MAVGSRRAFALLTALLVPVVACSGSADVRTLEANRSTPGSTGVPDPGSTSSTSSPVSGPAAGLGDVLFPRLGNPGVDVEHYDLRLGYDPATEVLDATATLEISLTEERQRIGLDAVGLGVERVSVDDRAVDAVIEPDKVVVPLPSGTAADGAVTVVIDYRVDVTPQDSVVGLPVGWFATAGGSYVLNEPDGARTWMPCNDHPSDKATYDITIEVPAGTTGVANGLLVSHTSAEGVDVWHWRESKPMATYLVLVLTGEYELVERVGPHGLPSTSAVLRSDVATMQPFLDAMAEQIGWFEQWFGPYPLEGYGIAITDSPGGLAMETQGRSLFSRDDFLGGELEYVTQMLLGHELAHQWFGDAVTPARWSDIWLNESFATYAEWMWIDHVGLESLDSAAASALRRRPVGSPAAPAVEDLFGYNSYSGGAVTLHALRLTVGDDVFFEILREWVQQNLGASRTTTDFVALAETVSGRSLGDFFEVWLYADRPPSAYPSRGGV